MQEGCMRIWVYDSGERSPFDLSQCLDDCILHCSYLLLLLTSYHPHLSPSIHPFIPLELSLSRNGAADSMFIQQYLFALEEILTHWSQLSPCRVILQVEFKLVHHLLIPIPDCVNLADDPALGIHEAFLQPAVALLVCLH